MCCHQHEWSLLWRSYGWEEYLGLIRAFVQIELYPSVLWKSVCAYVHTAAPTVLSSLYSQCLSCVFSNSSAVVLRAIVFPGGWRKQLLYEWTCVHFPLGKTIPACPVNTPAEVQLLLLYAHNLTGQSAASISVVTQLLSPCHPLTQKVLELPLVYVKNTSIFFNAEQGNTN